MSTNHSLQERKNRAFAQSWKNLNSIFVDKAKNTELWDVEGNRYLDFSAGIAVVNTGHSNQSIIEAVHNQLDRFTHTCFMVNPYESAVLLAEKLNQLVPIDSAKSIFLNTGAEAVENSIKIARAYTKRTGVVSFQGGFHGRTYMCLGLTGKVSPYKVGFAPFPNDIYHIPFPVDYYGITVEDSMRALQDLFSSSIAPEDLAAIIIEPVQGEGGFHQAPIKLLEELRKVCDRYGIVLICDEIQTGFGRTGTMFAIEHYGVNPDLITMAKGLAGGFPLSAVVGKSEVMDAAVSLGGTFGGSPLACTAALQVLEVIEKEQLCERANQIGTIVVSKLKKLQDQYPNQIGDVRQSGAMIAFELIHNGNANEPNSEIVGKIIERAVKKGLILLNCGTRENAIRILTPLTIEMKHLEEGLEILEQVLKELL